MIKIPIAKETGEELNDYVDQIIGMRGMQNEPNVRNAVLEELFDRFCRAAPEEMQDSLDISDQAAAKLEKCLGNINQSGNNPIGFDTVVRRMIEWNKELDEKISDWCSKI